MTRRLPLLKWYTLRAYESRYGWLREKSALWKTIYAGHHTSRRRLAS